MSEFSYVQRIESRMDSDAREMLRRIYEPTVVGAPLSDARRDVCVLPSGELRAYGLLHKTGHDTNDGKGAYLRSVDGGLSWTRHYAHGTMGSCTYFEESGIYLAPLETRDGLWIKRSTIGPDDPSPAHIKVADGLYGNSFLPQRSRFGKRIYFTSERADYSDRENPIRPPVFIYSDDEGASWTVRELPPTPPYVLKPPHRGLPWCRGSGSEPHATELPDGRWMMIIRSPHECFYQSFSEDGGDSWSDPEPSTFYGTNTTAFLLRLSGDRILALWNNTKPLAQGDHEATFPPVSDNVKKGIGENAFTNRDAAHAAISLDGGRTFRGYREILLNPLRGNTDYRYIGGTARSYDKSVHQFQAFELPYNKVLVIVGQNIAARFVIFDLDWLLETDAREDFVQNALERISTHTFVRSLCDHTAHVAGNGHCAWNRAPAAYLMPDPEGSLHEVLSISSHHDDRMLNSIGGATWNFPASARGRVGVHMKLVEQSARLILADRHYNTCDPHAMDAPFAFEVSVEDIGTDYRTLTVDFDTEASVATLSDGDRVLATAHANAPVPTGISYLILQCATEKESEGFLHGFESACKK